jgi:hypothetical protein
MSGHVILGLKKRIQSSQIKGMVDLHGSWQENESDRVFTKGIEINRYLQSLQQEIQGVKHILEQRIRTMPLETLKNCENAL